MPCPICGNDGPNCDCSPVVRRMHADAEELLDRVAALEEAVPRWIPVAERLPDFDLTVWVYIPFVRQCEATRRKCVTARRGRAHFDGHDYWFWEDDDGGEISCVTPPTHWMPLPAPPEATS